MNDRELSTLDVIRLVLSYNLTTTDPNKPVMIIMPKTNKLYDIGFMVTNMETL